MFMGKPAINRCFAGDNVDAPNGKSCRETSGARCFMFFSGTAMENKFDGRNTYFRLPGIVRSPTFTNSAH